MTTEMTVKRTLLVKCSTDDLKCQTDTFLHQYVYLLLYRFEDVLRECAYILKCASGKYMKWGK